MKKKILYIDKNRIEAELLEVNKTNTIASELWQKLTMFGVTDPEAIKNPIDAVVTILHNSMPSNGVAIPLSNILKLTNKEEEYKEVSNLSSRLESMKYLNLLQFTGTSFSVRTDARQIITDSLTPYTTDPKEIILVERIEKMIDEAYSIAEILGFSLGYSDILRLFRAYRVEGKTFVSPGDWVNRLK
jgi:hypothetical protein